MPFDIVNHKIVEDDIERITEKDASKLKKDSVAEKDIVLSRRDEIHCRAIISKKEDGWLCGTGCLLARFQNLNEDVHKIYTT